MQFWSPLLNSISLVISQSFYILLRLILAYVIWLVGKWVIDLGVKAIDKLDVKKWKVDDNVRGILKTVFVPFGKVMLILLILDMLGVGSSVVAALASGFSLAVALTLGISLGDALKPEARQFVENVKNELRSNQSGEKMNREEQ